MATELRGCMTISHPGAISCRCSLIISRMRRRIRFRRTAFPNAFLTLHPNRLISSPLGRRKTVNSRPARRRPSRYTASYSSRRKRRQARGKSSRGESDARETMAPFLAALRKDFSSPGALHACAKAVLFMTASHMWLIRPLRQRCFSSAILASLRGREGTRSPSFVRKETPGLPQTSPAESAGEMPRKKTAQFNFPGTGSNLKNLLSG